MQKKCKKCGEVKDLSDFHKNKTTRDGLNNKCRKCCAAYYQANKESLLEYKRKYYEANRERLLVQQKEYQEANRERLREYKQEYHEANRERLREQMRERYEANRERRLEQRRKYYEAFPERQGFCSFCTRICKSTKEVLEDYNMTLEQIWDETRDFYLEARRLTEETGTPHHVDHIQPVCEGGEHRAYNLQVLTGSENLSKGGHWTQADDDLTDEDIERLDQEALSFSQTLTLA